MYALLTDETKATTELSVSDLVIYEFDQWSNPRSQGSSPTTMCWFEPERAAESAR